MASKVSDVLLKRLAAKIGGKKFKAAGAYAMENDWPGFIREYTNARNNVDAVERVLALNGKEFEGLWHNFETRFSPKDPRQRSGKRRSEYLSSSGTVYDKHPDTEFSADRRAPTPIPVGHIPRKPPAKVGGPFQLKPAKARQAGKFQFAKPSPSHSKSHTPPSDMAYDDSFDNEYAAIPPQAEIDALMARSSHLLGPPPIVNAAPDYSQSELRRMAASWMKPHVEKSTPQDNHMTAREARERLAGVKAQYALENERRLEAIQEAFGNQSPPHTPSEPMSAKGKGKKKRAPAKKAGARKAMFGNPVGMDIDAKPKRRVKHAGVSKQRTGIGPNDTADWKRIYAAQSKSKRKQMHGDGKQARNIVGQIMRPNGLYKGIKSPHILNRGNSYAFVPGYVREGFNRRSFNTELGPVPAGYIAATIVRPHFTQYNAAKLAAGRQKSSLYREIGKHVR